MRVSMSPIGSLTATPRGRRAFGTITRRGRGASPSARSGRSGRGGTGCSEAVVVASVVMVIRSPAVRPSPARLRHTGKLADDRALAEADPAQAELAHVSPRPAADLAPVVTLGLELGRPLRLQDEALLRH